MSQQQPTSQSSQSDWLETRSVLLIASAAAFWILTVVWPVELEFTTGWFAKWRLALYVPAGGLLALTLWSKARKTIGRLGVGLFVIAGVLLLILGTVMTGKVGGTTEVKFASGVGGLSVVALFLGLRRFDTVRAAASLAVAILAIGVLTFPGAKEIVGEDNVATIERVTQAHRPTKPELQTDVQTPTLDRRVDR